MGKVKIATDWLMICSGCEVSLLDIHEAILDVLDKAEFVRSPVLADVKEFVPADVGIVTGGIRNEHNIHVAEEMRKSCKLIIALGSCACFGGIPGLANMYTREEIYKKIYLECMGVANPLGREPRDDLPLLTEKVAPLSSVIKVDVAIPGCPPVPELIAQGVMALLEGKPLDLPKASVCDPCLREKTHDRIKDLKRWYKSANEEVDPKKCFLEQGYLCLGPATWGICDARCTNVGVPCRGCHGPLDGERDSGIAIASFMGSLASDIPKEKILDALAGDSLAYFYQHQLATTKLGRYQKELKK
ncbi:MAG: F420-nonreducing hydrogenase [Candidatus Hermodarchaeota archaeon]